MVDYNWDEDNENVWPWDWDDDGSVCPNNTLDHWESDNYDDYEGDELKLALVDHVQMWFWDKQDELRDLWHKLMVKLHLAKEEEIPF